MQNAKSVRMLIWGIWVVMTGLLVMISTIIAAAERSEAQR